MEGRRQYRANAHAGTSETASATDTAAAITSARGNADSSGAGAPSHRHTCPAAVPINHGTCAPHSATARANLAG